VLDDEDHVEQAVALRDAALSRPIRMLAPAHWIYEVVNGLVSATRARRISTADAEGMLVDVLAVPVELVDLPAPDVLRTATRLRISAYDAAYVTLAEQLDCPCWTADRPLLRARGAASWVRPIERFTFS
jgi:predicted nucleic acid-binding protein